MDHGKLNDSDPIWVKPQSDRYIIVRGNKGKTENTTQNDTQDVPKVDWNGVLPMLACSALLLPSFISRKKDEKEEDELNQKRLAEITGLRFPRVPEERQ